MKLAKKSDLTALTTRVDEEEADRALSLSTDYGVKFDNTGDDNHTRLQAAVDDAAASIEETGKIAAVKGRAGVVRMLGPIVPPENKNVEVIGMGKAATVLSWPNDLGAGQLAYNSRGAFQRTNFLRHMTLKGPAPYALGVDNCDMDGVRLNSQMGLFDVRVEGFRKNIIISNDHHYLKLVDSTNGYYNAYWEDAAGVGNQDFDACNLAGARFASVGVSREMGINFARFAGTHFGYGPYAIYLEEGVYDPPIPLYSLHAVTFDMCSFEALGNGLLYDEDHNKGMFACTLDGCMGTYNAAYKMAARDADFTFRTREIVDLNITGGRIDAGDIGTFDLPGGGAFNARTIKWSGAYDPLQRCRDSGKRLISAPQNAVKGFTIEGDGIKAKVMRAPVGAVENQLLSYASEGQVWAHNVDDQPTPPMGAAYHDAASGEWVAVVVDGPFSSLTDDTIPWDGFSVPVYADERPGALGKVRVVNEGTPMVGALGGESDSGLVPVEFGGPAVPPKIEDWVAPTLQGTWVNLAGFSGAGYYKDPHGRVHFRGMVTLGTTANIFVLPAGYRPPGAESFPAHSSNAPDPAVRSVGIDVAADGQVYASGATQPTWLSLNGISFRAS